MLTATNTNFNTSIHTTTNSANIPAWPPALVLLQFATDIATITTTAINTAAASNTTAAATTGSILLLPLSQRHNQNH